MIVGASMMFSSTLVGLKLLPNDMLHQQHIGEMLISILIIQDIIAIASMMFIQNIGYVDMSYFEMIRVALALPLTLVGAFILEYYLLSKLFRLFSHVREYLFVLSLGWCLALSEVASWLGMTHEIGAFIAGVTIATGSIATYLAECFNPIRDFFLVLFFFSIGANLNVGLLVQIKWSILLLSGVAVFLKPLIYQGMISLSGNYSVSWELGVRLGQASEFSLILANLAIGANLMSETASVLVQAVVMVSFFVSSYWVSKRFETPSKIESMEDED